jgi:spore coat protein U-like protein
VSVSLDRGTTAGSSISARRLADGRGNTLDYQLYTSVTRSTVWGDGTAGSATVVASGLGLASTMQFVVHGVIPAGQSTAVPGQYTDSITITLTY